MLHLVFFLFCFVFVFSSILTVVLLIFKNFSLSAWYRAGHGLTSGLFLHFKVSLLHCIFPWTLAKSNGTKPQGTIDNGNKWSGSANLRKTSNACKQFTQICLQVVWFGSLSEFCPNSLATVNELKIVLFCLSKRIKRAFTCTKFIGSADDQKRP